MDSFRDWDVNVDGVAPVMFDRKGFIITKELLATDDNGDHYAVTDGKTLIKLSLVRPSPAKIAADQAAALAAKPEQDRVKAEMDAVTFFHERISDLPVMNDDEWAQLSGSQKTEHLRNVLVGVLGSKLKANELLDAEAAKMPGLFSKLWSSLFG